MTDVTLKHTPGPWLPYSNSAQQRICTHNGGDIASVHCSRKEWLANARLIAAAPELLAALRACEARLQSGNEAIAGQARAAIAKATE
jgi:hypothetical protein